ncbi:hypothetical protein D3C80_1719170 [compost metagenome]
MRHAAQALHQLADFGFIAEGGDSTNHLALNDYRHGIGQQFAAVKADLLVTQRLTAFQHLRQMQLCRPVFAGGFQQQVFERPILAQQPFGFVVDNGNA